MSPEEYISRMSEISGKKYELLRDMHFLTESQSKVMTEEGMAELQDLIIKKQTRIEQIDKLDEEFKVYFQRLKQTLKVKSLDELDGKKIPGVKELQGKIQSIMNLLKDINKIDSENSKKANDLLSHLGSEMKKISQTKQIGSAYKPIISAPPSYFIDKKK